MRPTVLTRLSSSLSFPFFLCFWWCADVVLVAGDVGDTMNALTVAMRELKSRFRRVFLTPGNHDLWIRRDTKDGTLYPDSICKLAAMHNVCESLGVDMGPAEVATGLVVVPLFSWYACTWDEADPKPGVLRYDAFCKWPDTIPELSVWEYMLRLNARRVSHAEAYRRKNPHAKVFSMSHFLPRTELPYPWGVSEMAKAVGCKELDLQVRIFRRAAGPSRTSCRYMKEGPPPIMWRGPPRGKKVKQRKLQGES